MTLDKILTSVPMDKKTAVLTSQTNTVDELTHNQIRDNIKRKVQRLREEILLHPKKSDVRKSMGIEIQKLDIQLKEMRTVKFPRDLGQYIIDVLKPKYNRVQWKIILNEAMELKKKEEKT